jgi:hypothetical protein
LAAAPAAPRHHKKETIITNGNCPFRIRERLNHQRFAWQRRQLH